MSANRPDALRGWAQDLGAASLCAVFLALIGPFGSYLGAPLGQRLGFQLLCFWLGTLVFGGSNRLIWRRVPRGRGRWLCVIIMVAAVNLPFSWLTATVAGRLWPVVRHVGRPEWYLQGLLTAEPAVLMLAWLADRRGRAREVAPSRVPPTQGLLGMPVAEVVCLQMEDHYIRVHGAARSHLVHATMGQALDVLRGIDGLRVHRSWWVARRAIVAAERDGRNLRLRLSNGVNAPVARAAVASLVAVGVLA